VSGEVVVVTGGDLHRGVGQPRPKNEGDECTILPVDAMEVRVTTPAGETSQRWAVAHVCAGRFGRRSGFAGVVNAGFVDGLNLAPRGHPGDGRVELILVDRAMPWRQRAAARRRARTGSHVPHPSVHITAVTEWECERVGHEMLFIDGVDAGAWWKVSVLVRPGRVLIAV
jgi:hypothetical protein